MSEVIFAQLCKTVSSVDEAKSHVINLWGTQNSDSEKEISSADFINLFYSETETGNYKFNMNLDGSSNNLCKKYLDLSGLTTGYTKWYETNRYETFEVAKRVPEEYGVMMGVGVECFDTCSLMKLRSELLELEDLCKLCKSKQSICCSLSLTDLVSTLNDNGTDNRTIPTESSGIIANTISGESGTFINNTQAQQFLKDGDLLTFSILITNPSNKVKDVELKLHFKIKN